MSSIFVIIFIANLGIPSVICQIDLGSFSLGQDKHGDLKIIFNQAANILGFGSDRGLDLTVGEGRFKSKARQGVLISGQRIGADSTLGINEAEGVNFNNFLNFGNNSISFDNPAGQFFSFLEGIKNFFIPTNTSLEVMPSFLENENSSIKAGTVFHNFYPEKQQISEEKMNYMQSANDDYNDYYQNIEAKNETVQKEFQATIDSSVQEDMDMIQD